MKENTTIIFKYFHTVTEMYYNNLYFFISSEHDAQDGNSDE